MDYFEKYIKYKTKYIKYKQSQLGGCGSSVATEISIFKDEIAKKLGKYDIKLLESDGKLNIISIKSDKQNKPNLVMLAGFSHKSFMNSSNIIIKHIDELLEKFNIYLIQYASYASEQSKACKIRDEKKLDDKTLYDSEIKLNDKISIDINSIIKNNLKLDNVHLLGKCAGGGIMIHLLEKDSIYKALYLAVPASPTDISYLKNIDKKRLNKIKFIFGWSVQDHYQFHWNRISCDEKVIYDKRMKEMGIENYIPLMEDKKVNPHTKDFHEIPDLLIETIVKNM